MYIGLSRNLKERWRSNGNKYKGSHYFYYAIQKYGWDNFEHTVLYDNLTEQEAKNLEIELIAKYQTQNSKYGYNLAEGGGVAGVRTNYPHGEECVNAKAIHQYTLDGQYIRSFGCMTTAQEETGANITGIRLSALGQGHSGGFLWSYELVDSLPPYKKNEKWRNSPILKLDKDYNIVDRYDNLYAIPDKYDLKRIRGCLSKTYSYFDNHFWCFENDYDCFAEKMNKHLETRYIQKNEKQVNQYTPDGKLIATYRNARIASEQSGIHKDSIHAYCGKKAQAHHGLDVTGYIWRYAEDMKEDDINGEDKTTSIVSTI